MFEDNLLEKEDRSTLLQVDQGKKVYPTFKFGGWSHHLISQLASMKLHFSCLKYSNCNHYECCHLNAMTKSTYQYIIEYPKAVKMHLYR